MSEENKDIRDPKPGEDKTSKNKPGEETPEAEKTAEEKQIETLQIQKEHQREKREEAEDEVVGLKEEVQRLKDKKPPTPSEELPDEEMLTDTEKALKKKQAQQEQDIALLKEKEAWKEDLAKAKAKFPQLAKREDEFKKFCYKYPKGIDAVTLAKSFLFDEKSEPEKKVPERKGLETPTGGPSEVPKTGMSLEDIKRLREENFPIYIKMVREGKIKEIPKE